MMFQFETFEESMTRISSQKTSVALKNEVDAARKELERTDGQRKKALQGRSQAETQLEDAEARNNYW